VCGCDGKTYGNACTAAAEGVSVAQQGECKPSEPEPTACGGLLGADCPKGQYCNFALDAQCGAADQTGVCAAIPEVCYELYAPVCGCDDKTYPNDCYAAAAGVSVVQQGECGGTSQPEPTVCGGLLGAGCPTGQYCKFALDAQCGAADQTGVCEVIPESCYELYAPVCGCDDKTYPNDCHAAAAGVSIVHEGEC
jgi:hypothetical protein